MSLSPENRRAVLFGLAVAAAHALVMVALVGYAGGSRAVSVGLDTLVSDHLAGLMVAAFVAGAVAWAAAIRLDLRGELPRALAALVAVDLVGSVLVVAAVGELGPVHVPLVFVAATGLGTQLVAAAMGLGIGALGRRSAA